MLGWFAFLVTTLFELEGDNNGHAPQVARSRLQRNDEHPAKPGCTKSPRRHSCGCCGRNEGGPCAGRPTWFASSSHRPAQPGRIPTAAPQLSAINRARRKHRRNLSRSRTSRDFSAPGASGLFLVHYALGRILVEPLRDDEWAMQVDPLWITAGQTLCIPMLALGVFLLGWSSQQPTADAKE